MTEALADTDIEPNACQSLGTATYSPEDNKLRLYPFSRLAREDYDRMKAVGFIWAPKQELFVAPAWTPEREDLLVEFCGEIEDEDKSLVDRAEERSERFDNYADARKADADQAQKAVHAIADNIPLGQPILIGHHSEKRARRDAERIENGMRRAVKMWETSKYWTDRAASAIAHAKYLERPDVRARRIKKIEADKRQRERAKAESEHLLRFWRGELMAKNPQTGERRPITINEESRAFIHELTGRMSSCGVQMTGQDGTGWFTAYDMTAPDGERYRNCPEKTVAEIQAAAIRIQTASVERDNRWLAHFDNRLAYERAMLAADGGTESDKIKPEKGGACRCWCSDGCWSIIQKVNKVSVTLFDNWGNGGRDFTRTIPFDKLSSLMSKADVDAAREAGLISTAHREYLFRLLADPAPPMREKPEKAPESAPFEAMRETFKAGGVQVIAVQNLFPTPPEIAQRMVDLLDIQPSDDVLEPSAGTGNLLMAMRDAGRWPTAGSVSAVEINPTLCDSLRQTFHLPLAQVVNADFLEVKPAREGNASLIIKALPKPFYDRVLMNPPFDHGADIRHIMHAINFLRSGGRLVAVCAAGPRQREALEPLGEWIDLSPGSFKNAGTNVSTALVIINT